MRILVAMLLVAGLLTQASAQQDTTPPALLGFTIQPVVFDAGAAPVHIDYCITASDNLSGLALTQVIILPNDPFGQFFGASFDGTLEGTICSGFTVPQFAPYGDYSIQVEVYDKAGNLVQGRFDGAGTPPHAIDLCAIATCKLTNRAASNLPDQDADG